MKVFDENELGEETFVSATIIKTTED